MVRIKSPQDLGAAVLFVSIGVAGVFFGTGLEYGSPMRMGPGFFPAWVSWLLIGIGVVVSARSLVVTGPPIEAPRWRTLVFINASILLFGFLIGRAGLALSVVALTFVAAMARPMAPIGETAAFAVLLSVFTAVVFVYLLGQPIPLWWAD
jgi:hypothetical protein